MDIIFSLILLGISILLLAGYIIIRIKNLDFDFLDEDKTLKFKIFSLSYFFLLTISILIYYTRANEYIRPLSYFVCLSFMFTIVIAEIIYSPNQPKYNYLIIFQIVLISTLFIATQVLMYPTVLSYDPWKHELLTEKIIEFGKIPNFAGSKDYFVYTKMPGMHLMVAESSLIVKQEYKISSLIFIGLPTLIINAIFIYLISKRMFNSKIGLISVLFISFADNNLDMAGKNIVPNSIGIAIVLAIIYILLCKLGSEVKSSPNSKYFLILVIFSIYLSITHSLSYGFLLISVFTIIISAPLLKIFNNIKPMITKNSFKQKSYLRSLVLFFIFLILLVFPYWIFIAEKPFIQIEGIFRRLFNSGPINESYYTSGLKVPFADVLLSRAGMILYFAIAIIGVLWILFRTRNYKRFFVGCLGALLIIASGTTFMMFAFKGIEHRFWYYGEIINGVTVAIAVILIYKILSKRKYAKKLVLYTLTFIVSFLMITSGQANNDNPLVKSYSIRTGFTMSEMQAMKFTDSAGDMNFGGMPIFRVWSKEGYDFIRAKTRIELKKFSYIAVTIASNGTAKIYINGVLDNIGNIRMPLPDSISKKLIIGGFNQNDLWHFDGSIGYIRIYNRTLTSTEIQNNYNGNIIMTGLVSEWNFDEGKGDTAHDSVGNNDGIIYGGNWSTYVGDNTLLLDGLDDYVDCGNDTSLDITDEITIEAYVNLSNATGHKFQFIVGKKYRWALEICENHTLPVVSDGYYSIFFNNPQYLKNFNEFFSYLDNQNTIIVLRKEMLERAFLMGPPYRRTVIYPEREIITNFFGKVTNQKNVIYTSNTVQVMN